MSYNPSKQKDFSFLLDAFNKNAASLLSCQKQLDDLFAKKVASIVRIDTQFNQRLIKHNNACVEAKAQILTLASALEEELNKTNSLYNLSVQTPRIMQELNLLREDNKNKFLRLKNEYTGKITIVEKESALKTKEIMEKQLEDEKTAKLKFFELEKKAISEVDQISEEVLLPVNSKINLDINAYLNGTKPVKPFNPSLAEEKRINGIKKICEISLNFLQSKRDFEIEAFSSARTAENSVSVLAEQTLIDICNLRKVLEHTDTNYNVGIVRSEYLEFEKRFDCLEQIIMYNYASKIRFRNKQLRLEEIACAPYKDYEHDKKSLVDDIRKADLEILNILHNMELNKYLDLLATCDHKNEFSAEMVEFFVGGLVDLVYEVNEIVKKIPSYLVDDKFSSSLLPELQLGNIANEVKVLVLEYTNSYYALLNDYLVKFNRKKKRILKSFDEFKSMIEEFVDFSKTLLAELDSRIIKVIDSNYNLRYAQIKDLATKYFANHANSYNEVINVYNKDLASLTATLESEKAEIYKELEVHKTIRDEKLIALEDELNARLLEIDNEINSHNAVILELNKNMESDILAYKINKTNEYQLKMNKVRIDSDEKLKRVK